MSTKQAQIDALAERLEKGYGKIGEAMANGIDVAMWEREWVKLLREYERLNDVRRARAAGVDVQVYE